MTRNEKILLLVGLLAVLTYTGGATIEDYAVSIADSIVSKLAYGIALAEGFFVSGSRPQRNHNPGDLTQNVTGTAIGRDGIYMVYSSDSDGWEALKKQVRLMFGGSHIYNPQMTISDVASHYTTTQQNEWADNVASYVGVSVDTKLADIPA